MAGIKIIPTRNFERNMDGIEQYLSEQGEHEYFRRLLNRLFDDVIPNLQAFPEIGRNFMATQPASVEGARLYRKIRDRIGATTIREYLFDQYLLLYMAKDNALYLLSIKHHAQLSFDLPAHY